MTDPQVAEIVGKLTKAQREAVENHHPDDLLCATDFAANGMVAKSLCRLGLMSADTFVTHLAYEFTPLGLAVRQHLTQSGDTINDR